MMFHPTSSSTIFTLANHSRHLQYKHDFYMLKWPEVYEDMKHGGVSYKEAKLTELHGQMGGTTVMFGILCKCREEYLVHCLAQSLECCKNLAVLTKLKWRKRRWEDGVHDWGAGRHNVRKKRAPVKACAHIPVLVPSDGKEFKTG